MDQFFSNFVSSGGSCHSRGYFLGVVLRLCWRAYVLLMLDADVMQLYYVIVSTILAAVNVETTGFDFEKYINQECHGLLIYRCCVPLVVVVFGVVTDRWKQLSCFLYFGSFFTFSVTAILVVVTLVVTVYELVNVLH